MEIPAAYLEWVSMRDWSLGPAIRVRPDHHAAFREADRALAQTLGPLRRAESDVTGRTLYANSPWHAAFALAHFQHQSIAERSEHLIFRGQKRSSWELSPSIDRLRGEEVNKAILESTVFCHLMTKLGIDLMVISPVQGASFNLRLPPDAHMPVAQHYQINTPLLDFTTDPAVATYFASRDNEDAAGEFASIYVYRLPLPSGGSALNLRLPPPFIERPYLQKGIYIESDAPGDLARTMPWTIEVRFPVDADNHHFVVARENVIELLPESQEVGMLKDLASAGVVQFMSRHVGELWTPDAIATFAAAYAGQLESRVQGLFRKIVPTREYIDQYVARVEDMLYWLCYCPADDGLRVNKETLGSIVAGNPQVFRMMLGVYRRYVGAPEYRSQLPAGQVAFMERLIDAFASAMTAAGHDHSAAADLSAFLPR